MKKYRIYFHTALFLMAFLTASVLFAQEPIIRLYFTYPTDPVKAKGTETNIGSAYSTDGIAFTLESGARITGEYLTDADVIKEGTNQWTMFYSKATSPDESEQFKLYKATCSSPTGSFTADNDFIDDQGNISGTYKVGNQWYVCTVRNGKIALTTYDPVADELTYQKDIADSGADPSVIQNTEGKYMLFYKKAGDTYCMDSDNGIDWSNDRLIVTKAEVPGACCVDGGIYLYYVDFNSGPTQGAMLVRISSDNGQTFGSAQVITGFPEGSCDPAPLPYEAAPTYSISGTISGDISQGVTLILSGDASTTTTSGVDGTFSFAELSDGSYTVRPRYPGYMFDPVNRSVAINGANESGIDFSAAAINLTAEILKLSFTSSYKDFVKKIENNYTEYSKDKYTIRTTIQLSTDFDLNTIDGNTRFFIALGDYLFDDTLGNAEKSKFNGAKGGNATFIFRETDEIKSKTVVVEKIVIRWDKKKKLIISVTGTPKSDDETNILDLSSAGDSDYIPGTIDSSDMFFGDEGAAFTGEESLAYIGKKKTKSIEREKEKFSLVTWSAKGSFSGLK